jgi:hypothetical protein
MSPKARVCSVPLSSSAARRPEGLVSSFMVSMIVQQALAHAAGSVASMPTVHRQGRLRQDITKACGVFVP